MAKIDRMMVGEALVGDGNEVAHIDLIIGPRGSAAEAAFATTLTNQKEGVNGLLAVLEPNLMVKPATVMFNKVTIKRRQAGRADVRPGAARRRAGGRRLRRRGHDPRGEARICSSASASSSTGKRRTTRRSRTTTTRRPSSRSSAPSPASRAHAPWCPRRTRATTRSRPRTSFRPRPTVERSQRLRLSSRPARRGRPRRQRHPSPRLPSRGSPPSRSGPAPTGRRTRHQSRRARRRGRRSPQVRRDPPLLPRRAAAGGSPCSGCSAAASAAEARRAVPSGTDEARPTRVGRAFVFQVLVRTRSFAPSRPSCSALATSTPAQPSSRTARRSEPRRARHPRRRLVSARHRQHLCELRQVRPGRPADRRQRHHDQPLRPEVHAREDVGRPERRGPLVVERQDEARLAGQRRQQVRVLWLSLPSTRLPMPEPSSRPHGQALAKPASTQRSRSGCSAWSARTVALCWPCFRIASRSAM